MGGSDGQSSGGDGEPDDVLAAMGWLEGQTGKAVHLAGYSFGAVMSLAALTLGGRAPSICCIAFPTAISTLTHDRLVELRRITDGASPVRFISGDQDTICDQDWLIENLGGRATSFDTLQDVDHYFHGEAAGEVGRRVTTVVMSNL